jgi:hypothetical protein
MSQLAFPAVQAPTLSRTTLPRRSVRAVRPSLIDLRFKGDPWVVDNQDGTASLCLGAYSALHIAVSPLDLPALNRALSQVRQGQARRLCEQRRTVN